MIYQKFYFGRYSLTFKDNWTKSFLMSQSLPQVLVSFIKKGGWAGSKLFFKGKNFEKNNMASNDSKLPNSARNAKKNYGGIEKRRRTAEAVVQPPFFLMKDTKTLGNYSLTKKDFTVAI